MTNQETTQMGTLVLIGGLTVAAVLTAEAVYVYRLIARDRQQQARG